MSDRLSDNDVADIILDGSTMAFQEEIHLLAREVQEYRGRDASVPFTHLLAVTQTIDQLCDRHDITVAGIVRLVDDVFNTCNDSLSDGWTELQRRAARGEGQ